MLTPLKNILFLSISALLLSACSSSSSGDADTAAGGTSSVTCFWSDSCDSGRTAQNTTLESSSCTPLQQSGGQGAFTFTHNLAGNSGGLTFSYDVNGAPVQFVVTTPSNVILNGERDGNDSIRFNVSGESVVFVGIEANSSASSWQVNLDCPASLLVSNNDIEPNNDSASAQVLSGELIEVSGSVNNSSDFEDFFSFTPTVTGTYTFDLSGFDPASSDLDLYIADAVSQNVLSASVSVDATESITLDLDAGTEYIIKVQAFNTASLTVNYVLNIQSGLAAVTAQQSFDDNEPNSASAPQVVQGNSFIIAGVVNEETDISDGFEFTPTVTQSYTFTLTGDVADNDLYLFTAPVNDVNAFTNSSFELGSNESLTVTLQQGVTYVVEVYAFGDGDTTTPGVDAPYTLSVQASVLDNVVILPNGDSANVNGSLDSVNNLRDSYQFTPNTSQFYDIGISGYNGDIDLEVSDDSGIYIASSALGGNEPDAVTVELVAGVTYIINIDAYDITDTDTYTLNIAPSSGTPSTTTAIPQNVVAEVEPNNDDVQAQIIVGDSTVISGTVDVATDEFDFYAFTPSTTRSFTVTLVGFVGDLDLIIFSGDATAGFVQEGDSFSSVPGGAESITLTLNAGTTYYIGVVAFDTVSADTYFMEVQ